MKGLELSRAFWEDAVRPAIRETCPVLLPRLAAGLCGGGSDCLGYDDELSHDHGYAAGCMLFLAPEDAETHGFLLSALYDRLPREFQGVKTEHRSRQGNGRYGVKTTEQFLLEQTGLFHTPETWREWMAIPSYALAAACAGEIFYDGSGRHDGHPRNAAHRHAGGRASQKDRGTRRAHGAVRAVQRLPLPPPRGRGRGAARVLRVCKPYARHAFPAE